MSELTIEAVKKLKVAELKAELTKRDLSIKGKKDDLAKRLINFLEDNTPAEEEGDSLNESAHDTSQESIMEEETAEKEAEPEPAAETMTTEEKAEEATEEVAEPMDTTEASATEEQSVEKADDDKTEEKNQDEEVSAKTTEKDKEEIQDQSEEKTEKSADDKDSKSKDDDWVMVEAPTTEELAAAQREKNEAAKKNETKSPEKPKQEDKLMEVEEEEGEIQEMFVPEEGNVVLDGYTRDLNFIISENGVQGRVLVKNGFKYLWAGARANVGAKKGKVGFEVKILETQEVELPASEKQPNAVRVGWSGETSTLQLGESSHSYGYDSSGKVCASSSFFDYGETFGIGDVIGSFLNLESEPKTLTYTKNGKDLGVAVSLNTKEEKPLFPQILIRNMKVQVNFGGNDEPWFAPLEEYALLQNADEETKAKNGYEMPESKADCEVLMMIGLPNSGKTTWVKKHAESNPEKCYNVIGLHHLMEKSKLAGETRKKSESGYADYVKTMMLSLSKLYQMCPKFNRNYIYDQVNVYQVAQKTKMEAFEGFKRKACIMVPTHDKLRSRTSDSKRRSDGHLHEVPFGDLCDMKCNFHLPKVDELFAEVDYVELDEKNSQKTVQDYKSDGERAKRTGHDDNYRRRSKDDRSRNDRYKGGNRRDEGWKRSGSGYGGYGGYHASNYGQQNNRNYNRNSGAGGYYNKNQGGGGGNRDNRRSGGSYSSGGGGGGYRQNSDSSYGGNNKSNYRGGSNQSYGSYGGSNYGSSYGGSNYSSGTYSGGSYSSGGYTQSRSSSNQGGWSQSYPNSSSSGQWSGSGGGWGSGYSSNNNYNNYNSGSSYNNSYGGSGGYSY